MTIDEAIEFEYDFVDSGMSIDSDYHIQLAEWLEELKKQRSRKLDNKELIETLKIAQAEVEREYPLDYAMALEETEKLIEFFESAKEEIKMEYNKCYEYISKYRVFEKHTDLEKLGFDVAGKTMQTLGAILGRME